MKPLVAADYILEKFPGKGGWTYALIPEVLQNKDNLFGWVKVYGAIDDYMLKGYKLMPYGNDQLFLPVKAAIRKLIKKEAGDTVHITLYEDLSLPEIPEDILACFRMEDPLILASFRALAEGGQQAYLKWIQDTNLAATKESRIVRMMELLSQNKPSLKKTNS